MHRVQVSGGAKEKLLSRGGALIADYGSYALVDASGEALAALPKDSFVNRDDYRNLLLNAGTIDTAAPEAAALRTATLPATGRQFHLVQFNGPVKNEWYAQLQGTGAKIVAYIPHNAYLVYGDSAALTQVLSFSRSSSQVQWDGPYLNDYKINPRAYLGNPDGFQIQLIEDAQANADTIARAAAMEQQGRMIDQRALGYVNLVLHADRDSALSLATRPDVVSIIPFYMPKKLDERANQIAAGRLAGNGPAPGDYMTFLVGRGFTQAQFDASGIGVDVSDSGLDNATLLPNHYGLYVGGDVTGVSRVNYARLEGSPNTGSTIQGCDGHGTLNCHIIGGASTLSGGPHSDAQGFRYNLGIAPYVRLGSSVIFDPNSFTFPDYEDLQSRAYRDGMRVSSNSWGAAVGGAYNTDSQRYDALVRDAQPAGSAVPTAGNQEMVIVFAAGNSGPSTNSVGSPGTAKNIITAGAAEGVQAFGAADQCGVLDSDADSANDIVFFSSRGPMDDQRIKPDLVAAGSHVSGGVSQAAGQRSNPPGNPNGAQLACFNAGGVCAGPGTSNFWPLNQEWTTASSGTSHSTPLIAGAAALVQQRWRNQNGGAAPSAAMVKAILMNGARYMTGAAANDNLPSNNQGMGYLDLSTSLDDTQRLTRDQDAADLFTATGQSRSFDTFAGDPSKPFRVTLVWTDAPGATTGNAFNNNLDLTVTIGANTYRGNVFTGRNSTTGGTADVRNNAESVFLAPGVTGPVTIRVTATNIVSDGVPGNASALDQDFALVAYNTCPNLPPPVPQNPAASVPGDNQITITWDASAGATSYRILRSTVAAGPYTSLATVDAPATSYTDSTVSGGTTYFYVVRSIDCAESANSAEVSALATGECRLPPVFAGLTSASNARATTCGVDLSWTAATQACAGTITYDVYRSRTAGFVPSAATRIATGLATAAYSDTANLQPFTPYYYIVRAVEVAGTATNTENNTAQRSASPTGPVTAGIRYFDDQDATRPPNAANYWLPSATTINTTTNCRWQSTNRAWRFGQTSAACGGTYPLNREDRLVLGGNGTNGINGFAIPAATPPARAAATLSFAHAWTFENNFDGAFLEYSTQGSAGPWTAVPGVVTAGEPYIVSGTYNGHATLNRAAWTMDAPYPANGSFTQTVVNAEALAGQTVWFAWHYVSDISIVREGHYLDDVRFETDVIDSCSPGTVPPGPAVRYVVTLPATSPAGAAQTATITAMDVFDQTADGYGGTANLTTSDAQATIPATAAFTAGIATASATFGTVGVQTLTATDGAITGTGGTTVTPGAPAELRIGTQPTDTVAGADITPAVVVRVVDSYGNLVTTSTASVDMDLGANPGNGTLNGTTTQAAVGGIATFDDLNIEEAADGYTLVASSAGLTSATTNAFDISPDFPVGIEFAVQPGNIRAGNQFNPLVTVRVVDQFGNINPNFDQTVIATLDYNPQLGVLLGDPFTTTVNGVGSWSNLSVDKVGTGYTLTAIGGIGFVTSTPFDVTYNVPYQLAVTQEPTDTQVAQPISPVVVEVQDRYHNLVADATLPLTASLRGGNAGARLLGLNTQISTAGVATFDDLAVNRAGVAYALDIGSTGLHGTTTVGFDVTASPPGPPASYAITGLGQSATASVQQTFQVEALDAQGNRAVDYNGTASVASNDGQATLPGNITFASGVASNVHITFKTTGIHTMTVTDTTTAALTSTLSLVVTNFPQPTVSISEPQNGSTVTGSVNITANGAVATGTTLTRLEIFVDGTSIANGATSPVSGAWDTANLKGGSTHLIHAVVTDAAGNVVQSTPLTVIVGQQGCGCSTGSGGMDMAVLAAVGAALRAFAIRRRRAQK